ncbi:DNA circularization N-terminal domain-containing protein [Ochrobactrum intermedium]|uniref:DNA circularization N-terminal domain-containing protein n=1 Tax=Brucella intermedia TaxID=94625 RepID=UPI00159C284D|nr:DNA circularization N-terminal domain-containing protein [Brucella intermedia]NVM42661.1 DNA circularization N-terminal domain-containing protein [Brucella intermedia]
MIFDSISDVLPGLLPASYRGISFHVPDTSTQVGRRVAEHLFPGVDQAAYDDFGLATQTVQVEGLIVSDSYIAQAQALKAAFETPGPGTLIHPWLGPMQVIMEETAEISFAAHELRVVRFSATFKRYNGMGLSGFASTASALIGSALSLVSLAASLTTSTSRRTLSRLRADATQRTARQVVSYWQSSAGRASALITAALPQTLPATPEALSSAASSVTDMIVNLVPDLAGTPAVAPAAEATSSSTGLSARQALDINASAGAAFVALAGDTVSRPDTVLLAGTAGDALAKAGQLAAYVEFGSRAEASALRDSLVGQLDAYTDLLSSLSDSDFAAEASATIRATRDVRLCLIADINEAIGRLPASRIIETDRPTDAFQIANHIYGDDPSAIEDGYLSIIERNRPRHPARIPAGRVEVTE